MDNNATESPTMDAAITYVEHLLDCARIAGGPEVQLATDLSVLYQIRQAYTWFDAQNNEPQLRLDAYY